MISAVLVVVLTAVVFVALYKHANKNRLENFPPGPPCLPIYGSYGLLRAVDFNNLSNALIRLCKLYKTDILGFYLNDIPAVVVNGEKMIREVLYKEELDGRMDITLFRLRSYWKKLGIFFTDGYFWHTQRRFSLRYMRDYGFGRRDQTLEDVIAHEIKEMIDMRLNGPKYPAEKELVKGDLISLPHFFAVPFINGVCHVLARMTLARKDYDVLWDLARAALQFQRNSDDFGGFLSVSTVAKDIAPEWSGYNKLVEGNQYMLDFFTKLIDEAIATHEEGHDRHFLDMYITQMKKEQAEKKKTTYSVEQLRLTLVDYMFPPASATEAVLTMLVERLLLQPEIQHKIHEEIDRVVGRDRPPTLDDRRNMPYTEACIRECLRFDTLVPLGVPHRATENTKLQGYDIPEGTMFAANYVTLHESKEVWGDPENFRPERFLVDGELSLSKDRSLPFGAGRRLCAGETYARQTMFQVFSAFMQAFQVSAVEPLKGPAPRIQGIITTIPEFWVRVSPRK